MWCSYSIGLLLIELLSVWSIYQALFDLLLHEPAIEKFDFFLLCWCEFEVGTVDLIISQINFVLLISCNYLVGYVLGTILLYWVI